MGFFKKIFKPVSKVLDKVIPNEVKPLLPYAAAFAPYLLGPGAASGSMFQRALFNPYTRAGIMGGINASSQLAQEGNEGDINALSAGLAALQGFGTAGGAKGTLEGFKSPLGDNAGARTGIMKFRDKIVDYGITGADKLQSAGDLLGKGGVEAGLNMDTLAAASVPVAQGTGDLMLAEGKRAQDAYEDALAAYEAEMGDGATDVGRALAIRTAMQAYGFLDEEIEDTIAAAGYRAGGRVGLKDGTSEPINIGIGTFNPDRAKELYEDVKSIPGKISSISLEDIKETGSGLGEGISSFYEAVKNPGKTMSESKLGEEARMYLAYSELSKDQKKEMQEMGLGLFDVYEYLSLKDSVDVFKAGGRVGLRFGGIDSAVENIENQDVKESAEFASATSNMDIPMMEIVEQFELKFKRKPNSLDELKQFYKDKYGSQNIQEKITETVRTTAAEGGLMNLGGKEMDMRGGGFIPIGKKERADDVPARLSKNEFVMTADAVRAAGGGSVNKGAKRMYETMNKLEARA